MANSTANSTDLRPLDLGNGPLVQSILVLTQSSLVLTALKYLMNVLLTGLYFLVEALPMVLSAVEAEPDELPSLEQKPDGDVDNPADFPEKPFEREEKVQASFEEVMTAPLKEWLAKERMITSSLSRIWRYWFKLRGIFSGLTYCNVYLFISMLLNEILEASEELVRGQIKTLASNQSIPWYLTSPAIEESIVLLLRLSHQLLAAPVHLACIWRILTWQGPGNEQASLYDMPWPSKRAIRHMLVPTVIEFALTEVWNFYPDSLIYLLFVATLGPEARPNVVVAAAILLEQSLKFVARFALPWLVPRLLIRVEASLLPDNALPILNFDRTYGLQLQKKTDKTHTEGRIVPPITMADAWTTMTWDALWRMFVIHVKTQFMFWAVSIPAVAVISLGQVLLQGVNLQVVNNNQHVEL